MSFPRYPAYKDSGVEWLGEVPEHWSVGQSRRRFALRNQRAHEDDEQLTASQKLGIVKQIDFVESEGRRVVEVIKGADILKHVEPGDFIISMRSFQGGIEYSLYRGSISSAYVMLSPIKDIHPGFFRWLFKSDRYIQALQSTSNLVRDGQALRFSNFTQVDLPLIPHSEQASIASFLDDETAKIDALIAEQQRLIELLQEKRQAVISQAVTKGLNPDAPMKDSGVEWLGEVPEHWENHRLKNLFALKHGYAFDGSHFSDVGEYVLMTPGNFNELGGFRRKDPEKYYAGNDVPGEFILKEGQMLIVMTEQAPGLVGTTLFVPPGEAYLHNQRLGLVTRLREELLDTSFLYWLMNSPILKASVGIKATGQKVRHTSPQKILENEICLPPLDEQKAITQTLFEADNRYGKLTDEANDSIRLLLERRSALISAAVTGQIDVRGLVPEAAVA
ncbi:restriction endonuclease subunit S [Vulcanococcus limneticus]|uniref:restriction endonuclease subunit S n=1 Tax=Vulcanococcus limneticus TaxID=2170428 RepID=UPI000B9870F3|nr:restriction endonuclease subunit S [Vulcanococcus limneticus]MCP9791495.1 restriction endonuclease subunit S [Vulcanococcus limneticus MW73D5]MCP9898892.1 restriction endonuclease subunit S [Vulcanococcus limneticus Candia 3B3]